MAMRLNWLVTGMSTILLLAGAAAAQPEPDFTDDPAWPDSAEARQAKVFLDTFNTGDASRYQSFVEKSFAPSLLEAIPVFQHVGVLLDVYQNSQGYEFCCIRHHSPALPG